MRIYDLTFQRSVCRNTSPAQHSGWGVDDAPRCFTPPSRTVAEDWTGLDASLLELQIFRGQMNTPPALRWIAWVHIEPSPAYVEILGTQIRLRFAPNCSVCRIRAMDVNLRK